jgi:uracil-DNA glycosylase
LARWLSVPARVSARAFTLPEIRIVSPKLVICLGLRTFRALARAEGRQLPPTLEQAIATPFMIAGSRIHCVAHTGALGMNNRSREQVDQGWKALGKLL